MTTICITDQKGGVGKTSSVISIGAQIAAMGHKVLLIDGDPSCNLTAFFCDSLSQPFLTPTLYDYFAGNADSDELPHRFTFERYPGDRFIVRMECIADPRVLKRQYTIVSAIDPDDPDNPDLDYIDIGDEEFAKLKLSRSCSLSFIPHSHPDEDKKINITDSDSDKYFLRDLLKEYSGQYEFVLIDCPPEDMPISDSILYASDYALIPTEAANDSIRGIGALLQTIQKTDVKPLGVYFTKINPKESVAKKLSKRLKRALGDDMVYASMIRSNAMQEKSRDAAIPLCILRPSCALAEDYRNLTEEILNKPVKGV